MLHHSAEEACLETSHVGRKHCTQGGSLCQMRFRSLARPGEVVGIGGLKFDLEVRLARQSVAVELGSGQWKTNCNIAIDDLVYYLAGVLDEPRTFGQRYDVGSDEGLTIDQMIDICAEVQGHSHPPKFHLSLGLLEHTGPLIEHLMGLPRGAVAAGVQVAPTDLHGNPDPIRAALPRPPLSYREAVQQALRAQ